jgi:uncharacterized protein (DUF2267 family)
MRSEDVFEPTVRKSYEWIDEVAGALGTDDRRVAYAALRAVLHALRDRLALGEAVDLSAQLPVLIRGVYFDGWRPSHKPEKWHLDDFLAVVQQHLGPANDVPARSVATAVFGVIAQHVSKGEIDDVYNALPKDLRELWR